MKITLVGTGTSGGVPSLGCHCRVCSSNDPHDHRLRCAALLETDTTRILIDSGPDIRQQLMPFPFSRIDGVLLTHGHYDHVGGLDDLRPFSVFGSVDVFADATTCKRVHEQMPYCFGANLYPGVLLINLHEIKAHVPLRIGDVDIMPVQVMHDRLPILGYRFGKFAYITDMKTIADEEYGYLEGIDTLVVNALRMEKEHHSHQLVRDAIKFAHKIKAKRTFLIHCSHQIGLHEEVNAVLPSDVRLAYDGQVIYV